jgi:hypothetical protein
LRVKIYTRSIFSLVNIITLSFLASFSRVGVGNHIFPGEYYHTAFFWFLSAECALGIIFLAISFIFTYCERDWFRHSPTQKKHCSYHMSAHNTQPHHQKRHTRQLGSSSMAAGSFAAAGSLGAAAAVRQCGGGNGSLAVAGSLVAAAHQCGGGSDSLVAAGNLAAAAAAAWWQRGCCGGSGSLAAVAAWRRRQHGGGRGGSLVAVAAWRR